MHNITCLDIVAVRHWFQPTEMEIPIRYTYACVYIYTTYGIDSGFK